MVHGLIIISRYEQRDDCDDFERNLRMGNVPYNLYMRVYNSLVFQHQAKTSLAKKPNNIQIYRAR